MCTHRNYRAHTVLIIYKPACKQTCKGLKPDICMGYTHKVWCICVHPNKHRQEYHGTVATQSSGFMSAHYVFVSGHQNKQKISKQKKPTTTSLLRVALLLTEDIKLRTASPCCLALDMSACLCPNAHSVPQLITGNTTHGLSCSRLSLTSAHTQSGCLTRAPG